MLDPSLQHLVIQVHLFSTLMMTGVIWYVQVVHYPFLALIRPEEGERAARFHKQRTSWVVMPLMLVELTSGILLLGSTWMLQYGKYLWGNLLLLFMVWGITFFRFVPLHKRLENRYDRGTVKALVSGNWIRTILWSVRSLLLLGFLG